MTVHNQPIMERTELPPQGKTAAALRKAKKVAAKQVAPVQPPPQPEFRTATPRTPRAKRAAKRADSGDPSHAPLFRPPPPLVPPIQPCILRGVGSADGEQLARNASLLQRQCAKGLPAWSDIQFHGDVLALQGVDLGAAETAVRHPESVSIDAETGRARHPILRFMLGDVLVAVGFRQNPPMIIAAYFSARLVPDTHRTPERLGGGGNKAKTGVPTSARALLMRLRGLGAEVDEGDDDLATVSLEGKELGKIMLGRRASRASCGNDWQRMQRKIPRDSAAGQGEYLTISDGEVVQRQDPGLHRR